MIDEIATEPQPGLAVMPHSPSNEEAFIGSLLIDAEPLRTLYLAPEDFYIQRNAWVYEAILEVYNAGQAVDSITVCTALDEKKRLNAVGGYARVIELMNRTASTLNIESYANTIQAKAKRRRVIQLAQTLANCAFDEKSSLEDAISRSMDQLARSIVSARGAVHIKEFASMIYDEVSQAVISPCDLYGIPTGFTDWDVISGGLQKCEVVKLTGEPGVGKSLLAVQVICQAAAAGHPCALYELEMSGQSIARRRLSAMSKITTAALRSGKINETEINAFNQAVETLSSLPVYVSDSSVMTTGDIRADLTRLKDNFGVELAVIDYEGLIADETGEDEIARSKIISSRMHGIFKDLEIAGLVIDDMTKAGISGAEKGKAGLSGSARKIYDADQIIILRKCEEKNTIRATWEKFREGEPDRFFTLTKLPGFPAFEDAATKQQKEEADHAYPF